MSDQEISAYPSMAALETRRDAIVWGPGLRLIQHRGPQVKGFLLLLLSWPAVLLLSMLALNWVGPEAALRSIAESAWPFIHRIPPGAVGLALIAVLYLAVCAWMSLGDPPTISPVGTEDAAASLELAGPHEPGDEGPVPMPPQWHCARELSNVHLALQLGSQQVGAAIGEAARRTISLCGAFDSCTKHVEVAGADLDAVQDEAAHTQQLMASLRTDLLTLGGHCQALGRTARRMTDSAVSAEAAQRIDELLEALHAQIVHCHQLSERIGGAELSSQRRVDSIRRCIEGLGFQADRGLREGHQVMVLTRQIETSLAEGSQRLEQLATACAAPPS